MNKNHYIWIGIAIVTVIIIAIVFMNNSSFSKNVSSEDIQISEFVYASSDDVGIPFYVYDENEGIRTQAKVTISTNRDDLYLMIYDGTERVLFFLGNPERYDGKLDIGENKLIIVGDLYLSSLSQQPELKFCVSTKVKYDYDLQDTILKDAVCKTEIFDSPEFKYEIFPNPLIFNADKDSSQIPSQTLTIKNIGKNPVPFMISTPDNIDFGQPWYYVDYNVEDNFDHTIKPGEAYEVILTAYISGDTLPGEYLSQGFIYGQNLERPGSRTDLKSFTIKTIVNA